MTYEPTVLVTSQTAAEIHLAGEVDEVFASTQEGLRSRIVESIRLMAASAGEPVTATVVDGATRWALVVSPDGSFTEATAPAVVSTPAAAASVSAPAATPGAEDVSSVAASSVAAPISAVPLSTAAAAVAESVTAETAAEPGMAAAPTTSTTTAVATATVDGQVRSGATRREGAQRSARRRRSTTCSTPERTGRGGVRPRAGAARSGV
ncbi:hypothetical protein [Microbacterium hominis]|uniref:hypothetical protein n=1 Tax=Microbacterium hominis TaxID=162426 RepID=UPI000A7C2677|nr:hypothetical protein [Microbacterium hominis]